MFYGTIMTPTVFSSFTMVHSFWLTSCDQKSVWKTKKSNCFTCRPNFIISHIDDNLNEFAKFWMTPQLKRNVNLSYFKVCLRKYTIQKHHPKTPSKNTIQTSLQLLFLIYLSFIAIFTIFIDMKIREFSKVSILQIHLSVIDL